MSDQNIVNKDKKKGIDRRYWVFGLKIIGDFGASIAIPVVLFAYIGQKLDSYYDSGYKLTAVGFTLAALVTGKMILKKAKRYGKEFEELE